jgi:hypothetical protein
MNFFQEWRAFSNWTLRSHPPTGQIVLWYALMDVCNFEGWSEWFQVSTSQLQALTGMSKIGVQKARDQLVQKGLIQYHKGTKNGHGRYKVVTFTNVKVSIQVTAQVTGEVTAEVTASEKTPSFYKESFKDLKDLDLDIDKDSLSLSYAHPREREELKCLVQKNYGHEPHDGEVDLLLGYVHQGMRLDLVEWAIQEAKIRDKPWAYAFRTVQHLCLRGIQSAEEAEVREKTLPPKTTKPQAEPRGLREKGAMRDERYEAFYDLYPELR